MLTSHAAELPPGQGLLIGAGSNALPCCRKLELDLEVVWDILGWCQLGKAFDARAGRTDGQQVRHSPDRVRRTG